MRKRILLLFVGALLFVLVLAACSLVPGDKDQDPVEATLTPIRLVTSTPVLPENVPATLPPTWTPSPSITPTATLIPTATDIPAPFQPQLGSPRLIPAFSHTEEGCGWQGVAGQVFDENGQGMANVVVIATAKNNGIVVDQVTLTDEESLYGPGGYEISLSNFADANIQRVALQLYSTQGQALTDSVTLELPGTCDQNLILMNFQAGSPLSKIYLPGISHAD